MLGEVKWMVSKDELIPEYGSIMLEFYSLLVNISSESLNFSEVLYSSKSSSYLYLERHLDINLSLDRF